MSSEIRIKTIENVQLKDTDTEGFEGVDVVINEEKTRIASVTVHPAAFKQYVKDLYLKNHTLASIIETTGVKKGTLLGWMAKEKWADDKKELNLVKIQELIEGKKLLLNHITTEILEGIAKTVVKAKNKDGSFNTKDLAVFSGIASNFEKLSRLAMGMATSISEERSKRAQFSIPLEHLKDANLVKVKDPFDSLPMSTKDPLSQSAHPEENDDPVDDAQ